MNYLLNLYFYGLIYNTLKLKNTPVKKLYKFINILKQINHLK